MNKKYQQRPAEKPGAMTAEEFYKDHFGHTSQHVSMDKIFVCMELYARHKKATQEVKQKLK